MENMLFKYELPESDLVTILDALAELPYKKSAELIYKLRQSAQEQIEQSRSAMFSAEHEGDE